MIASGYAEAAYAFPLMVLPYSEHQGAKPDGADAEEGIAPFSPPVTRGPCVSPRVTGTPNLSTSLSRRSFSEVGYTNLTGDTSFTYDNNGNFAGLRRQQRTSPRTAWWVRLRDGIRVYAPTGIRRNKTAAGATSWYTPEVIRDQGIEIFDANFNPTSRCVYGPNIDEPIVWIDPNNSSSKSHLHRDGVGSTVADSGGTVSVQYSYPAYGIPTNTGTDA